MPRLHVSSLEGRPLLDIASYARRGPGHRDRLSADELAHIGRTVQHTPEVMVKVLSKDSNNLRSVARHLNYIGRRGELELETDNDRMGGRDAGQQLVEDWDLDLDQDRRESQLSAGAGRAPKLVHKIVLSMPPGTPAKGVLEAVRNFAREEFALKHRYALVLHTDEPHPHVHLVVKTVSEQGVRLNISKAKLREWRQEFARHLRDQGIAANATERAVRGESRTHQKDGIYRATKRGDSTYARTRAEALAADTLRGAVDVGPGKSILVGTRKDIQRGWLAASDILHAEGHPALAAAARQFINQMPPPQTDKEQLILKVRERKRMHQPGR
jgi:MobA/VirD2-like, nuclease domain